MSESERDTENNKECRSSFSSTQDENEDKEAKQETVFTSQESKTNVATQNFIEIDDNRKANDDDYEDDDGKAKISFYVKVVKHKKFENL